MQLSHYGQLSTVVVVCAVHQIDRPNENRQPKIEKLQMTSYRFLKGPAHYRLEKDGASLYPAAIYPVAIFKIML